MTDFINKIICGDNIEVMKQMPDNCIDTIITDPPYGLGFMGKEWDTFKGDYVAKGLEADKASYGRRKDKTFDHKALGSPTQIASPATIAGLYDHSRNREFQQWFTLWATEVLRIAKPGAIMLIFGGTRTYHRLTCAIEDAGWQIRDCMMWLYGSGFPKSHNISKAIDKAKGKKRKSIGTYKTPNGRDYTLEKSCQRGHCKTELSMGRDKGAARRIITSATSKAAQLWDGYGTALKPAWEPIVVAMKPLDGTFAENAEKWGVAGLWIDGARIGTQNHIVHGKESGKFQPCGGRTLKDYHEVQGRWPANLILDEEAAAMLDEQSGVSKSTGGRIGQKGGIGKDGIYGKFNDIHQKGDPGFGDVGGASRFFYTAKASKSERNAGCEGLETKTAMELTGRKEGSKGLSGSKEHGNSTNPYANGGSVLPRANHHPTVKPLKLMEYLCTLTKTPTGGIVLDPFGGSGSTAIACVNTGRDFILIEKEPEYCEIAEKRVKHWAEQQAGQQSLFEKGGE